MYDWVPNKLFERFVQNTPQKDLAIARLKSFLLGTIATNKLAVSSTTETSFKNKILVDVLLIEDTIMLLYERRRSCSLLLF